MAKKAENRRAQVLYDAVACPKKGGARVPKSACERCEINGPQCRHERKKRGYEDD